MFLLFLWLPSWWCQDTMIRWYLKKYASFVTPIRIQHSTSNLFDIKLRNNTHTNCLLLFFRCFEHCCVNTYNHLNRYDLCRFYQRTYPNYGKIPSGQARPRPSAFASLLTRKSQPCLPRMRFGRKLALQVQGRKGVSLMVDMTRGGWYSWKDFWDHSKGGKAAKWRFFSEAPKSPAPKRFLEKVTSDLKCLPVAVYDKCCLDLLACSPSPMI